MFNQLLTPVGDSLPLSFLAGALPIVAILFTLGVLRRPAWQAALAGLVTGLFVAVAAWRFPLPLTGASVFAGVAFAAWPILWIVLNALLLHNVAVASGSFAAFRDWLIQHLPNDRRVMLVVIGFSFGALLEGIAGFGTPVAITSSLLILLGFAPLEAIVCTLIFNTAPVAFAALGVPVTTLAAVTHLPAKALAEMVGRQLPLFALVLPFYVTTVYAGMRSLRDVWPLLLVTGGSFSLLQFLSSNYLNYALTDVVSSLGSILAALLLMRFWQPPYNPRFEIARTVGATSQNAAGSVWFAWAPWFIVTTTVIVWTLLGVSHAGEIKVPWPGLDRAVSITAYGGTTYAAVWDFQPLGTGSAILLATLISTFVLRVRFNQLLTCIVQTWREARFAALTVTVMIALAYLMNYSGINYTLGAGISELGIAFVVLAPFLGWIAVFLSGSDTSGNALFGNLQVIAANNLQLNPVLFAATNSSGGVMAKMISPQSISTGLSATKHEGEEGHIFVRTFPHSIALTFGLGAIVCVQQFAVPWIIPH